MNFVLAGFNMGYPQHYRCFLLGVGSVQHCHIFRGGWADNACRGRGIGTVKSYAQIRLQTLAE